jgi:transcriptional regulator with XRE-family HTH domain
LQEHEIVMHIIEMEAEMAGEDKEYLQVRIPDKEKLSRLLNKLKGDDRTMAQYAADCGDISPSTLSRILNGRISKPLSIDVLQKLYEHKSPDCELEFRYLADANGMMKKDAYESRTSRADFRNARILERREADRALITDLSNELFDRGYMLRVIRHLFKSSNSKSILTNRFDYEIQLQLENTILRWQIVLLPYHLDQERINGYMNTMEMSKDEATAKCLQRDMAMIFDRYATNFLIDAWQPDRLKGKKQSYVFTDQLYYDEFHKYMKNTYFHNEVTTILMDETAHTVIKEEWFNCPQAKEASRIFDKPVLYPGSNIDSSNEYAEWDNSDDDN